MTKTKIIIVCGPTASGKTSLGIELAKKFNGEIVSADSQQVWRGFDVGTAKANIRERSEVKHHLIDVAGPNEVFTASRFVELADAAIADIVARGKMPFVVGGTGMYIKMLERGFCEAPPRDDEVRSALTKEAKIIGVPALHERLAKVDPDSAKHISPNDTTRVIRALEIFEVSKTPASKYRAPHAFSERRYDALKIGLEVDRKEIYARIDARVDEMMKNGLLEEVKELLRIYPRSAQPFLAVGYRELLEYLDGKLTLERAVELTKQKSRNFAKRQLTWFRADKEIKWFGAESIADIEVVLRASFT